MLREILSIEFKDHRSLHTFLILWTFMFFSGTLNEDILVIKVRREREKGPKWSLAFDLKKIKEFTGKDKR